ncbi:MAG: lamin tail domain-containing protein [Patescibacteria group bacterium]
MIALCFLLPIISMAQVEIVEIMYDLPEGSDSGREWIRIYNNDSESVNLDGWRLFEAETNHKIVSSIEGDSMILAGNTSAIIVDNVEKFKIDWPNFSGLIFDSAFSLSNTGEQLILRNMDLEDVDSVSYQKEDGANGDGNTLQKINGFWSSALPTLGTPSPSDSEEQDLEIVSPSDESSGEEEVSFSNQSGVSYFQPKIKAHILVSPNLPTAGADFLFEGESVGLNNFPLENEKYIWSFGDGARVEGQKVLHAFVYPGDYLVTLEVVSGKYSAIDRIKMKVVAPEIFISNVSREMNNSFIELNNPSKNNIDLSWWRFRIDNQFFTLPKNTILLANTKIAFSSKVTNLYPQIGQMVYLLYPNGEIFYNYLENKIAEVLPQSSVAVKVSEPIQKENIIPEIKNTQTQTASVAGSLSFLGTSTEQKIDEEKLDFSSEEPTEKSKLLNKWRLLTIAIATMAVGGTIFVSAIDSK